MHEDETDQLQPARSYPNDTLTAALARYQLELSAKSHKLTEQYCQLLWNWNDKINLTRHTDYERFVSRDIVDTVKVATLIHQGEEVIEIGSGGGIPGLLLAILRPDLTVTLTESVGKKAKVLQTMVRDLKVKVR